MKGGVGIIKDRTEGSMVMHWELIEREVGKCKSVGEIEALVKKCGRSDVVLVLQMALKQLAQGRMYRAKRNAEQSSMVARYKKAVADGLIKE